MNYLLQFLSTTDQQYRSYSIYGLSMPDESKVIYRDLLKIQREWLIRKNKETAELDEGIIKQHLIFLDMKEGRLDFI